MNGTKKQLPSFEQALPPQASDLHLGIAYYFYPCEHEETALVLVGFEFLLKDEDPLEFFGQHSQAPSVYLEYSETGNCLVSRLVA